MVSQLNILPQITYVNTLQRHCYLLTSSPFAIIVAGVPVVCLPKEASDDDDTFLRLRTCQQCAIPEICSQGWPEHLPDSAYRRCFLLNSIYSPQRQLIIDWRMVLLAGGGLWWQLTG